MYRMKFDFRNVGFFLLDGPKSNKYVFSIVRYRTLNLTNGNLSYEVWSNRQIAKVDDFRVLTFLEPEPASRPSLSSPHQ